VEEVELEDDTFMITTSMENFHNVQKKIQEMGLEPDSAELQRIPNDSVELTVEQAVHIMKIVEEFEDDDDVQTVSHNLEVTEAVNEAMG
jgi:transcriptional/translational regulatory protein YebC/TACO1